MKVDVVAYTAVPELQGEWAMELVTQYAGGVCHGRGNIETYTDIDRALSFIEKYCFDKGHESLLEHCSVTLKISGVSRVLTHQLVRHRIAAYSQESQRYVSGEDFEYVMPRTIAEDEGRRKVFQDCMSYLGGTYNILRDMGVPQEDARFVLPNATQTTILCTWNLRTLAHIFKLRSHKTAQWEIRDLMDLIYREIRVTNIMSNKFLDMIAGKHE